MYRKTDITLLLLIAAVLLVGLLKLPKNASVSTVQYGLVSVAIMVSLYHILQRESAGIEAFETNAATATTTTATATTTTSTAVSTLPSSTGFTIPDLSNIMNHLRVYISCFDAMSYPGSGSNDKEITNISPNAVTENKTFTFATSPQFSPATGFNMSQNTLFGPLSMNVGIQGNYMYTLFWHSKLLDLSGEMTPVIRIYANNVQNVENVAISLRMRRNMDGSVHIIVQHGNDKQEIYSNTSLSDAFLPMDKQYHLYTLVRLENEVRLYVDDMDSPIITGTVSDNSVTLSNRAIEVGSDKNWNAYMTCFGVFSKALSKSEINSLYKHIEKNMVMRTETYKQLNNTYQTVITDMDKRKKCSFDNNNICQVACTKVTDWSDIHNVLTNGSQECIKDIVDYCNGDYNNNEASCKMWKKDNLRNLMSLTGETCSAPVPSGAASGSKTGTAGTGSSAANTMDEATALALATDALAGKLKSVSLSSNTTPAFVQNRGENVLRYVGADMLQPTDELIQKIHMNAKGAPLTSTKAAAEAAVTSAMDEETYSQLVSKYKKEVLSNNEGTSAFGFVTNFVNRLFS